MSAKQLQIAVNIQTALRFGDNVVNMKILNIKLILAQIAFAFLQSEQNSFDIRTAFLQNVGAHRALRRVAKKPMINLRNFVANFFLIGKFSRLGFFRQSVAHLSGGFFGNINSNPFPV